jgi:hypothetical protein
MNNDHVYIYLAIRRCVATWLVFLLNREKVSQLGIEPPTTTFGLGISPLSFRSLGSSHTINEILILIYLLVRLLV